MITRILVSSDMFNLPSDRQFYLRFIHRSIPIIIKEGGQRKDELLLKVAEIAQLIVSDILAMHPSDRLKLESYCFEISNISTKESLISVPSLKFQWHCAHVDATGYFKHIIQTLQSNSFLQKVEFIGVDFERVDQSLIVQFEEALRAQFHRPTLTFLTNKYSAVLPAINILSRTNISSFDVMLQKYESEETLEIILEGLKSTPLREVFVPFEYSSWVYGYIDVFLDRCTKAKCLVRSSDSFKSLTTLDRNDSVCCQSLVPPRLK